MQCAREPSHRRRVVPEHQDPESSFIHATSDLALSQSLQRSRRMMVHEVSLEDLIALAAERLPFTG